MLRADVDERLQRIAELEHQVCLTPYSSTCYSKLTRTSLYCSRTQPPSVAHGMVKSSV